jgi:DNA-binding MarR family transcriptional regulator
LQQNVIAALRRISRAIDLHSRLLLQKCGLTTPQLAALQAVERLQPVTVGVLAKEIHLSPATVTGILGRLEKRGLVIRARGDRDRRSVVVQLTKGGASLLKDAPSLLQDRFQSELSRLQEWEQTMILSTLQRIASMMDAEGIEAAPVLVPGVAGAPAEDVSRYLEKAVLPTEEAPLPEDSSSATTRFVSEEPPSDRGNRLAEETASQNGKREPLPAPAE